MKFIFVFLATIGLAKPLWSKNPSTVCNLTEIQDSRTRFIFKNFGISEMMKRIVSPDAGWDEDFGDLPEWLRDWGTTEADDGY